LWGHKHKQEEKKMSTITYAVGNITADKTLDDTASLWWADCTLGDVTVTLPTATGNAGRFYKVKRVDQTANELWIAAQSGELIQNLNSFQLYPGDSYGFVGFNNDTWQVTDYCSQ
jgi:hypothetical protein